MAGVVTLGMVVRMQTGALSLMRSNEIGAPVCWLRWLCLVFGVLVVGCWLLVVLVFGVFALLGVLVLKDSVSIAAMENRNAPQAQRMRTPLSLHLMTPHGTLPPLPPPGVDPCQMVWQAQERRAASADWQMTGALSAHWQ